MQISLTTKSVHTSAFKCQVLEIVRKNNINMGDNMFNTLLTNILFYNVMDNDTFKVIY